MRTLNLLLLFLLSMGIILSCKKKDFEQVSNTDPTTKTTNGSYPSARVASTSTSGCVEDTTDDTRYDSVLRPTILGYHLINHPYSLTNMRQAYTNLFGSASGVVITNKYVRFKPSNPQQLSLLDSLDIELVDHPLDYDIVQQGDYYDDGVTPAEEIPWLYAVVDANFSQPAGITYEELEQIHVPTLAAVENEAFRITGNPIDDNSCGDNAARKVQPYVLPCGDGYHWDYTLHKCVPNDCPPGYHWDPSAYSCVRDVVTPPPPTPTRQPSGTITVEDNVLHQPRPVRIARVVAKRFLKIERTYTNNQGQFFLTKEFNKVNLSVKFKNAQAKIRALRRARLWQILFSVKRNMGKFKGTLNSITHNIPYAQNALTDGARDWAAATAHNIVQEYYDYANQNSVGTPPGGIKILLSNWHGASGATPMYAKRVIQELPEDFLRFFVLGNYFTPFLSSLAYVMKTEIDVTVGYNTYPKFNNADIAMDASNFSETLFHELTHAAHYNKVGNSWWNDFVDGELNNIIWHSGQNPPYGLGDQGATSDIIALGESWAYHMGHFIADWKYGMNSTETDNFQFTYTNGFPDANLSSHLNALEDFDNHRTNLDHWIPMGLYYDLIDNRNDELFSRVFLQDQVSAYTNQQFFNALDPDIRALPAFRVRLLNENGNNQAAGVNTIFTFYNVF